MYTIDNHLDELISKEENFDQNNELFAVNPEKRTSLYESTALTVQCQSIKPNCTIWNMYHLFQTYPSWSS